MSPSAVSQQLAKLEKETGARLTEPAGRGLRFTDAALFLRDKAEQVLTLLEEAEADVKAQSGSVDGEIRLMCFPTAIRGLLPAVLSEVRLEHPTLRVSLREADSEIAVQSVHRGESDVAIIHDWHGTGLVIPDGLQKRLLGTDTINVALPTSHPLADRPELSLNDIRSERWVSTPPGVTSHDWLVKTMQSKGRAPDIAYQVVEYQSQLDLVAAGLGLAVVPRLGTGSVPEGIVIATLLPPVVRSVFIVWRAASTRRPAIAIALEALQRESRKKLHQA